MRRQGGWLVLIGSTLLAAGSATAKQREATEWSTSYWYNANENRLPRILLIGDSICNGYQSMVKDKLAGVAYTSFWATSKCITDPTYLKMLSFIVGEYDYEVIHFNNGLHSLGTDRAEWEAGLRAAFDLLKAEGHGAKIVWATSTPLKDPVLTEQAKELNAIAAKVVAEYGLPTNDLFALMDPQDRDKLWSDTFHYHAAGRDMQATQVAATIQPLLADWQPPAGADAGLVKNAGFEGAGDWSTYPPKPEAGGWELDQVNPHGGAQAAKITRSRPDSQIHHTGRPATEQVRHADLVGGRPSGKDSCPIAEQSLLCVLLDVTVNLTTERQHYRTQKLFRQITEPRIMFCSFNSRGGTYWVDDLSIV